MPGYLLPDIYCWDLSNILIFCAVIKSVMMNELMQIQKDLDQPPRAPAKNLAVNKAVESPEDGYDPNDWLALPRDSSRYHRGYTTNHWLSVFRAIPSPA